jgi:hypothetical protein
MAVHCPEGRAYEAQQILEEELTRPVWWLPNVPLGVDIRISEDYSK